MTDRTASQTLADLGLTLPPVAAPVAAYVPAVQSADIVFSSGQLPFVDGELECAGKVGADVTPERATEAARIAALNAVAAVANVAGGVDNIEQIIKVNGFVASAAGFNGQPGVINGASEVLQQIFGDKGIHARAAVGVAELPLDAPVEVEIIARVSS